MTLQDQKKKIRKRLLEKREKIPEAAYQSASESVIRRLKNLDEFMNADTIHCYVSMPERKEVNTFPLISSLLQEGRPVVVPVMQADSGELSHERLESIDLLEPNEWGVPEPKRGEEVKLSELDLVVVPMVGGDEECNRLGYGKGYYDRFLSRISIPRIGLCFEECITESIPVGQNDVKMSKIVTQSRVIH